MQGLGVCHGANIIKIPRGQYFFGNFSGFYFRVALNFGRPEKCWSMLAATLQNLPARSLARDWPIELATLRGFIKPLGKSNTYLERLV